MYSPDKMMGSKGLHGAPITAPGCFPSGRYSPPPYRAAPDPMPPPPRRCMPNSTVSRTTCFLLNFLESYVSRPIESHCEKFFARVFMIYRGLWYYKRHAMMNELVFAMDRFFSFIQKLYISVLLYICVQDEKPFRIIKVKIKFFKLTNRALI